MFSFVYGGLMNIVGLRFITVRFIICTILNDWKYNRCNYQTITHFPLNFPILISLSDGSSSRQVILNAMTPFDVGLPSQVYSVYIPVCLGCQPVIQDDLGIRRRLLLTHLISLPEGFWAYQKFIVSKVCFFVETLSRSPSRFQTQMKDSETEC